MPFRNWINCELFRGVAKWIRRVTTADRIEDYVDMAFTAAASGRPGPAVLLVSMDLLAERENRPISTRKARLGDYPVDRSQPEQTQIAIAAELLANAKAPIVYAGGGVISSGRSKNYERCRNSLTCRLQPPRWAKAAWTKRIRSRWASLDTLWRLGVWPSSLNPW